MRLDGSGDHHHHGELNAPVCSAPGVAAVRVGGKDRHIQCSISKLPQLAVPANVPEKVAAQKAVQAAGSSNGCRIVHLLISKMCVRIWLSQLQG